MLQNCRDIESTEGHFLWISIIILTQKGGPLWTTRRKNLIHQCSHVILSAEIIIHRNSSADAAKISGNLGRAGIEIFLFHEHTQLGFSSNVPNQHAWNFLCQTSDQTEMNYSIDIVTTSHLVYSDKKLSNNLTVMKQQEPAFQYQQLIHIIWFGEFLVTEFYCRISKNTDTLKIN